MNVILLVLIVLFSIFLGWTKYKSLENQYEGSTWHIKFIEFWNDTLNFLIAGFVLFYFLSLRLPSLQHGDQLTLGDFVLFLIFILGIFGHLCVMSFNLTKGVESILNRLLERK